MDEFIEQDSQPLNVPKELPFPAIDIANFNWKLWTVIKKINDNPRLLDEILPLITEYNSIYKLLPSEEKCIYLNPLGVYLGYILASWIKLGIKINLKDETINPKSNRYDLKKILAYMNDFYPGAKIAGYGMNATTLVRYIEYFKIKIH